MTSGNGNETRSFTFGPFVLQPERQTLLRYGSPVRIGARALEILTALLEASGEIVSKRELFSRVWPGISVEEGNLKVNVAALRRALREPDGPEYIGTVVGRGYRFLGPVHFGDSDEAQGLTCISTKNNNLPTGNTRIVGRTEAIISACRELEEVRLISIVGAGGVGKTRLALAIAETIVGSPNDGVWFVELASLSDAVGVPSAIGASIGFTATSSDTLEALCMYLRGRRMLLVLDSCEHLIDAVSLCAARILDTAPGIKILATSREPLRVKGERIRRLPGLPVPPVSPDLSVAEALNYAAVQLFVERAIDTLASFTIRETDASLVGHICRRLDGLPLAIELAAARVDTFGVAGLLKQIDSHLELLKGFRNGPERHRTLLATIEWSFDLLRPVEQAVLARLSVFPGTFALEAACAVAADHRVTRYEVVDAVIGLVAKSMIVTDQGVFEVRYRLLDTTRAYAANKLSNIGGIDDTNRRHAEYVLARMSEVNQHNAASPKVDWRDRYAPEVNDLRRSLSWAFGKAGDVATGVRLTVAALPFWNRLSLLDECRRAIELALLGDFAAHRSEHDELLMEMELGRALFQTRGPLSQGRALWATAIERASLAGDFDAQVTCLTWLANYDLWAGAFHSVVALSERVRQLAIDHGRLAVAYSIDRQAGYALRCLGAFSRARECLDRAMAQREEAGRRIIAAQFVEPGLTALGLLARLHWIEGRPDQAVALGLRQWRQAEGDHNAVSLCSAVVETMCPLALDVGDYELASRLLDAAEKSTADHGLGIWRAMTGCLRGQLLLSLGDPAGISLLHGHLAVLRECGFRLHSLEYLIALANGLARHGDLAGARFAADEAGFLLESADYGCFRPEVIRLRGTILRTTGDKHSLIAQHYREALETARSIGALAYELRAAISLVELGRETGGDPAAAQALASAYDRFDEGFDTRDLRHARFLLMGSDGGRIRAKRKRKALRVTPINRF